MTDTREAEWQQFSDIVKRHIVEYTIPQYGDKPNDLSSIWSKEDMLKQITKYILRHGKNQRPDQDNLDLLKIAHYACMLYFKEKQIR